MGTAGRNAAEDRPSPDDGPSVGSWGFAVFVSGFVGGTIGYFALRDTDPRRARHVMKWGLIWTLVGGSVVRLLVLVVAR